MPRQDSKGNYVLANGKKILSAGELEEADERKRKAAKEEEKANIGIMKFGLTLIVAGGVGIAFASSWLYALSVLIIFIGVMLLFPEKGVRQKQMDEYKKTTLKSKRKWNDNTQIRKSNGRFG